jgi:outer membrane protein OmpA-like peptidoglycan-associated protein
MSQFWGDAKDSLIEMVLPVRITLIDLPDALLHYLRDVYAAYFPARVVILSILLLTGVFFTDQGANLLAAFILDVTLIDTGGLGAFSNWPIILISLAYLTLCMFWTWLACSYENDDEREALYQNRLAYPAAGILFQTPPEDRKSIVKKEAKRRACQIMTRRKRAIKHVLVLALFCYGLALIKAGVAEFVQGLSNESLLDLYIIASSVLLLAFAVLFFLDEFLASPLVHQIDRVRGFIYDAPVLLALILLAVVAALSALIFSSPEILDGDVLDSVSGIYVSFSMIVSLGVVLTIRLRNSRTPVVSIIAFLLFVLSQVTPNNHGVRILSPDEAQIDSPRVSLRQAVQTFDSSLADDTADEEKVCKANGPRKRVFFVAAAGGGIRAGYWTATALNEIEKRATDKGRVFHEQLFAISGVSGGSLGATVYNAILNAQQQSAIPDTTNKIDAFFKRDYLGPVVGALLINDPLYLLSFGTLSEGYDRGVALEEAWERGWTSLKLKGTNAFEDDFLKLSGTQERHMPYLALNGTLPETGERLVASRLKIGEPETSIHRDFFDLRQAAIPASTAVNLSARFPYVSAAGHFDVPGAGRGKDNLQLSVVDGGYFENFGSTTIRDIVQVLINNDCNIEPHVIFITSDPNLSADFDDIVYVQRSSPENSTSTEIKLDFRTRGATKDIANEVGTPVNTLLKTRESRGEETARMLTDLVERNKGDTYHLRMCPPEEYEGIFAGLLNWLKPASSAPPLGWVMSEKSREQITAYLTGCGNNLEIKRILDNLNSTEEPVPPVSECEKCQQTPPSRTFNIYFDFNKATLTTAGRATIETVLNIDKTKAIRIQAQGHTDTVGPSEYNQSLSDLRLNAVKTALIDGGKFSTETITSISLGKESPPVRTNDQESEPMNRVVVIEVVTADTLQKSPTP